MVVLVPFLLITAVFSRITIMELNLPTGAGSAAPQEIKLTIEVVVREKGLEIGNGKSILARFPKVEDQYDLKSLSEYLLKIRAKYLSFVVGISRDNGGYRIRFPGTCNGRRAQC